MKRKEYILCRVCRKTCGVYHEATGPSWSDPGEPAFGEGIGENFVDSEGEWHCSKECLRVTEEDEAEMIAQDLDLFPNEVGLWVTEAELDEA